MKNIIFSFVCIFAQLLYSCSNKTFLGYGNFYKLENDQVVELEGHSSSNKDTKSFSSRTLFYIGNDNKIIRAGNGIPDVVFNDTFKLAYYGGINIDTFNIAKRYSSKLNLYYHLGIKLENEYLRSLSGKNDSLFIDFKKNKTHFYSQLLEVAEPKYMYKNICSKRYFFMCHICDSTNQAYIMCAYEVDFIKYNIKHYFMFNKYLKNKKKLTQNTENYGKKLT